MPDFASLADTRLDVESLAKSMQDCGVQKSLGSQECVTLDDSSFVVREPPNSDYRKKALKVCTKRVEHERGLPPVRVEDNEVSQNGYGSSHFVPRSLRNCAFAFAQ